MFDRSRLAVVVPAKNESRFIAEVVDTMPAYVDDLIVVDDGSTDDTASIARARGAIVLRHEASRGVGGAIVAGYRRALALGASVVAVMAGDGQMAPDDLEKVVQPVASGLADYAKGDRFRHPEVTRTMPVLRHVVGRGLSVLTGVATGYRGLSDSQCGFTAISRAALESIDLDRVWTGYGYPNDLLGHLGRAGLRVVDVPVRPVYRGEASGLRPWHVAVIGGLIGKAAYLRVTSASSPAFATSPRGEPARPRAR